MAGIVALPESKLQFILYLPVSKDEDLTSTPAGTLKVHDWIIPMLKPPELARNT